MLEKCSLMTSLIAVFIISSLVYKIIKLLLLSSCFPTMFYQALPSVFLAIPAVSWQATLRIVLMNRLSINYSFLVYCHLSCSFDGNLVVLNFILSVHPYSY